MDDWLSAPESLQKAHGHVTGSPRSPRLCSGASAFKAKFRRPPQAPTGPAPLFRGGGGIFLSLRGSTNMGGEEMWGDEEEERRGTRFAVASPEPSIGFYLRGGSEKELASKVGRSFKPREDPW